MSTWSSTGPGLTAKGIDGSGDVEIDVATAASWHDRVRLSMDDIMSNAPGSIVQAELTVEQAEQLITNLRRAIDRINTAIDRAKSKGDTHV